MVFSNRNTTSTQKKKQHLFAAIGSIIAVSTILATGGAANQLAFAPGGKCGSCTLNAFGTGTIICGDNTTFTSTISISAIKGKGDTASGTLLITTDTGLIVLNGAGTITAGKISLTKYSLKGTWDPNGICGATGTYTFSVSGPTGTSVPINFQSRAFPNQFINGSIASSSFTGTAQTTQPT
jgi:hypothetical protein